MDYEELKKEVIQKINNDNFTYRVIKHWTIDIIIENTKDFDWNEIITAHWIEENIKTWKRRKNKINVVETYVDLYLYLNDIKKSDR